MQESCLVVEFVFEAMSVCSFENLFSFMRHGSTSPEIPGQEGGQCGPSWEEGSELLKDAVEWRRERGQVLTLCILGKS